MLRGRHILLGVTGGIAAYKTPWIVRDLVKAGADVQVVMSAAAREFVTPLTLSTVSQRKAITAMFGPEAGGPDSWTEHIHLALWADVMLIAPATANVIARIAHGLADDFLTTLVLALRCPLALCPSMDVDMYLNEGTQRNITALREQGCFILEPDTGDLASGLSGPGRLPENDTILRFTEKILEHAHRDLNARRVLVTAGPTQEPIDPIRYVGNRSSGKMGFALAAAAAQRGADVTLIAGPVSLGTPRHTKRIDVATAREMHDAVLQEFPAADVVVMSAAVADFSPANPADAKIKRDASAADSFTLSLRKNPDILKTLGERKSHQVLVGFALETDNDIVNAQGKLAAKNLDLIVVNNPKAAGAAFGSDTNLVTLLGRDGSQNALPLLPKFDVANAILDRVLPLLPASK